ncbi:hypothetical protein HNQ64_000447 [Prosthecobacter dejongeii]|uniref:Uncharacterized protein n=1 Tax=Prosthecobacter dejongeii TaxID=48465 RepID=A0A7W8DNC1_9BACT|nr:hypothetical protein [Prosthecobacter dejongeii]
MVWLGLAMLNSAFLSPNCILEGREITRLLDETLILASLHAR